MDKLLHVAAREFWVTIRTKAFFFSVVLMPMIIVGGVFATQRVQQMAEEQETPDRRIAISDPTGRLYPVLALQMEAWNQQKPKQKFLPEEAPPDTPTESLLARINAGELYGYIKLHEDVLDPNGVAEIARRDQQLDPGRRLEIFINEAVTAVRFADAQIDPLRVAELRKPVGLIDVDAASGQARSQNLMARVMTPFVFMFLMFMGVFQISQGLLTSLIEEKSSRVMEVLLSAVSPMQLMVGKILGTSLVGVVLLVVWGTVGAFSADRYNLSEFVTPYHMLMAAIYFVPGFLLMSALLAGVGSTCNELKDAQGMVFPLSILSLIPMLFWFFIAQYPNAAFSVVLSYIPPITPLIMILRICTDPDTPLWQIVSTLAVLWVSVFATFWAAAKVFQIGVLMYGKPPSIGEIFRWLRAA